MKLFTFSTPRYSPMKRRFYSSLQDDYNVVCREVDYLSDETQVAGGRETWLFKARYMVNIVQENLGETIVYADLDIEFFGKTRPLVEATTDKHDLVFQRRFPHAEINTGFIAINCNSTTLAFWQRVLEVVEQNRVLSQQPATYQVLEEGFPVRWTRFPREIWHWNMGGRWDNVLLHHATGEPEMRYKLLQMDFVRWTRARGFTVPAELFLRYLSQLTGLRRSIVFRMFCVRRN